MSEDPAYTDPAIDELYKTLSYSNAQFDRQVLFIASGALAISFAFVEKVIQLDNATSKELLICAWTLFAASIITSLVSHFISIMALRWAIKYRHDAPAWKERTWNYSIRGLNLGMIAFLLFGLYNLIQFVKINV